MIKSDIKEYKLKVDGQEMIIPGMTNDQIESITIKGIVKGIDTSMSEEGQEILLNNINDALKFTRSFHAKTNTVITSIDEFNKFYEKSIIKEAEMKTYNPNDVKVTFGDHEIIGYTTITKDKDGGLISWASTHNEKSIIKEPGRARKIYNKLRSLWR